MREITELDRTQIELTKFYYKLQTPWKITDAGFDPAIITAALRELQMENENETTGSERNDYTRYEPPKGYKVPSSTPDESRWHRVGRKDPLECAIRPRRGRVIPART